MGLSESYAERERRKQAFTADVTKYSEKQRVVVQKAIDSGVLNNTNRSHEFVDIIAKVYEDKGISFDFANNKRLRESGFALEGVTVNGYVTKDGITINMDSPKAWQTTVGHEITHIFEGTELYTTLQEALFRYAKRAGTFDAMRKKITDTYKNIEGADISKELAAELVGEYLFTDEAFVKHLSVEHRNVFQRIYDEIKYLMKVVTAGSKEARQLEAVKHTFEKMYREGVAQKNTVGDGEVRYSISPTLDSDLDAVLGGIFNASKGEVYLGETSNFMTDVIGAQSLSKTMTASKMYAAMVTREERAKTGYYKKEPHYHGLGKKKVLEILEASENPIAAFTDTPDAEGNDRLDRIVLVTDVKAIDAETGNEGYAVVIEKVDTRARVKNKRIDVNKTITVYPMDRVGDQINLAIADGRILDIKKQGQYLAGGQGAKSQAAIQDTVLKNNIANFWANVKWENEKNKTFSSDSSTKTLSPIEAALQKAGLLDQDGHTQSMQNGENDASDVEALSLSSTDEALAPVGDFATPANELRYEGDVSEDIAPVREDLAKTSGTTQGDTDLAPIGDDVVIKTTAEKLTEKRNHSESERESLTAFREANAAKYDKMIAEKQAEYDALKNKDSKKANAILQSIERLKRLKADIDADYAKKIGNSEARINRLDTELSKDHTRKDKLARAYARIDRHLEADKVSLKEEFEAARKQLTADLADEGSYIIAKILGYIYKSFFETREEERLNFLRQIRDRFDFEMLFFLVELLIVRSKFLL